MKGTYSLTYVSDKQTFSLIVIVELKQVEGIPSKGQPLWRAVATINHEGVYKTEESLSTLHAMFAAERIGFRVKEEIKTKLKAEGKSFRIKSELIK